MTYREQPDYLKKLPWRLREEKEKERKAQAKLELVEIGILLLSISVIMYFVIEAIHENFFHIS